jgi:hypothetical protein
MFVGNLAKRANFAFTIEKAAKFQCGQRDPHGRRNARAMGMTIRQGKQTHPGHYYISLISLPQQNDVSSLRLMCGIASISRHHQMAGTIRINLNRSGLAQLI